MRERLCREYFCRVKMVLWTELYGRNKVVAINGLALLVLMCSFGIVHWGPRTCSSLIGEPGSSSPCTVSTIHQHMWTDYTYAPCNQGDWGLQQVEAMYKSCVVGLDCYLRNSLEPYMQIVYECESGRAQYSIKHMARHFTAQLQGDLAKDDRLQSLQGSGTVSLSKRLR